MAAHLAWHGNFSFVHIIDADVRGASEGGRLQRLSAVFDDARAESAVVVLDDIERLGHGAVGDDARAAQLSPAVLELLIPAAPRAAESSSLAIVSHHRARPHPARQDDAPRRLRRSAALPPLGRTTSVARSAFGAARAGDPDEVRALLEVLRRIRSL